MWLLYENYAVLKILQCQFNGLTFLTTFTVIDLMSKEYTEYCILFETLKGCGCINALGLVACNLIQLKVLQWMVAHSILHIS
jgi:hypothetical protein